MDKNTLIKNISRRNKSYHTVTLYKQKTRETNKVDIPSDTALYLIFRNMAKRDWNPYPSANNGLWKYLQAYIIRYCKDNSIYISDSVLNENGILFNMFFKNFNESITHKETYSIKTVNNNFFVYKKDGNFNFGLTDNHEKSYNFTYAEKELFLLQEKDNPIFSNIQINVLD